MKMSKTGRSFRVRRLGVLTGSGENALLQQNNRLSGPMPWVIAIMVALTVIAAAAGLSLRKTALAAEAELSGGVTVQIVEADPIVRARQAQASIRRLRDIAGVTDVRLVPQKEVDALIEPWLGRNVGEGDAIPVPALVDARVSDTISPQMLAELRSALRTVAPSARIDAQSSWLKPVFSAISSLQWLAIALVFLLTFAMAAAVLLAARTALGSNRETIEIVHLLGGTDSQVAQIFQRNIAIDATGGGLFGLILGAVAVLFLGSRFASLGAGLVQSGALGWTEWLILAAIPLFAVALATLTARISVLHALRRML
jgi:cell division transport system permease protein